MSTQIFQHRKLHVLLLGIACVIGSFAIGMNTSGDVRTIASLEAGTPLGDSDVNGDGIADIKDAIQMLEVALGHRAVSTQDLRADPNSDGALTADDALHLLNLLSASK